MVKTVILAHQYGEDIQNFTYRLNIQLQDISLTYPDSKPIVSQIPNADSVGNFICSYTLIQWDCNDNKAADLKNITELANTIVAQIDNYGMAKHVEYRDMITYEVMKYLGFYK